MIAASVAVIPARGGSKRIPRKNVKPFAGKPMIGYAIEAALRSAIFDRVVVSTDDAEIADVARAFGADVPFMRPATLSDDVTPTVPVILHAIAALAETGFLPTQVCCIYPAVPLIDPADLVRARDLLFSRGGEGFAFPVAAFPSPIQRALRIDAAQSVAPFDPQHVGTRTQDLEPAYYDAGQFYWGSTGAWHSGRSPHDGGIALRLPEWRVVDIDTPEDWERAERLYLAFARAPVA